MGIMAERLDAMVVRQQSPDGQIEGVLRDRDAIDVVFCDNSYPKYTERGLEYQLSRLAIHMWIGYRRGFESALAEASGQPISRSRESWDANRRRYREDLAKTVSTGMSKEGCVYVESTGLKSWNFVIRDGTLNKLDELSFAAEVVDAYHAMNFDYRMKVSELRAKHYGVSYKS